MSEKKGLVVKAVSGFYYVESEGEVYQTRARGVFRHQDQSPLVGDQVVFQDNHKDEGYLVEIADRKNTFVRPPVANVDTVFLVVSLVQPNLSRRLLDRYLTYFESYQVEIIIVYTKTDLMSEVESIDFEATRKVYEDIGYQSFTSKELIEQASDFQPLFENRIIVLAGQSGAGKSTLINHLLPDLDLKVGEISEALGRGRHTTRHVELHDFQKGKLADTPGFSAVSLDHISALDLGNNFKEIREFQKYCKFRGCLHINEPKCAVKNAVAEGKIAQSRYDSYLSFIEEIQNLKPKY